MTDADRDLDNAEGPPDDAPPEPPKVRSLLMDILERTRIEAEAETTELIAGLHAREENEKRAREEEEKRKAAEARRRVDEERRAREAALRAYEEDKQRKEMEVQAAAYAAAHPVVAQAAPPPKKSRAPMFTGIGVAAAVIVVGGIWALVPKGEPVAFVAERTLDQAKAGTMLASLVPYGPSTLDSGIQAVPADRVVAARTPARWEPPPPPDEPKKTGSRGVAKSEKKGMQINIQMGILGGGAKGKGKGKVIK